jgi:hypothetical protein
MYSMSEAKIEIKECKIDKIVGNMIFIIGARKTGKTVIVQEFVKNNFDDGILLSENMAIKEQYSKCEIFKNTTRCSIDIEYIKEYYISIKNSDTKKKHIIVIDEYCNTKTLWKDATISDMIMNGKHFGITLIITFQYPICLTDDINGNLDNIIITDKGYEKTRETLYRYYGSRVTTYLTFTNILTSICTNKNALVISYTNTSNNIQNSMFWCKASIQMTQDELDLQVQLDAHHD